MKYKLDFKLHWAEMIFVVALIFYAGAILNSASEDKFIYMGLALLSVVIILLKKRIRTPIK
ncbi:hypothetical protein [Kordia jejudonensis]|uniref:hypothetical protein n=1 Tax=Kordia jejudonensis TaxID=1348245 RepID=UPI00062951D0|nr:hypothetical protein [Kordia jejudonensis]